MDWTLDWRTGIWIVLWTLDLTLKAQEKKSRRAVYNRQRILLSQLALKHSHWDNMAHCDPRFNRRRKKWKVKLESWQALNWSRSAAHLPWEQMFSFDLWIDCVPLSDTELSEKTEKTLDVHFPPIACEQMFLRVPIEVICKLKAFTITDVWPRCFQLQINDAI